MRRWKRMEPVQDVIDDGMYFLVSWWPGFVGAAIVAYVFLVKGGRL